LKYIPDYKEFHAKHSEEKHGGRGNYSVFLCVYFLCVLCVKGFSRRDAETQKMQCSCYQLTTNNYQPRYFTLRSLRRNAEEEEISSVFLCAYFLCVLCVIGFSLRDAKKNAMFLLSTDNQQLSTKIFHAKITEGGTRRKKSLALYLFARIFFVDFALKNFQPFKAYSKYFGILAN